MIKAWPSNLLLKGKVDQICNGGWRVQIPVTAVCLSASWERGYADLQWKMNGDRIMPWYFMEYNGRECNGFGVMTGCSALLLLAGRSGYASAGHGRTQWPHGVRLGSRTLEMATVVAYKEKGGERPFLALRKLCKLMCPHLVSPSSRCMESTTGISHTATTRRTHHEDGGIDWRLGALATNNRPYCLIDAGWAVLAPQHKDASSWG